MPSGPPDFIGIGTHLAGVVWWAGLLGQHPQIHLPADGRWNQDFFTPFCARPMGEDDIAAYHLRFPRTGSGIVGEWSPRYLYDAWTPRLLQRAAPDAKLLVLVRDPVERYLSSLEYRLARERRHGKWVSMVDIVYRGRYASQLRALYEYFDPEQVLVLQYEQCRARPLEQYTRMLDFLGVDQTAIPGDVRTLERRRGRPSLATQVVNMLGLQDSAPVEWVRERRTGVPRVHVELWPDALDMLRSELQPEIDELGRLAPELDLSLWRGLDAPAPPKPGRTRARVLAAVVGVASIVGIAAGILAATTELF